MKLIDILAEQYDENPEGFKPIDELELAKIIFKDKKVNAFLLKNSRSVYDYNYHIEDIRNLSLYEFNLLKRVFYPNED